MEAFRASPAEVKGSPAPNDRPFNDENRQTVSIPINICTPVALNLMGLEICRVPAPRGAEGNVLEDIGEIQRVHEGVASLRPSADGPRAQPWICHDITNSTADTLRISRLQRGMTYDRLYSMAEPFGKVQELAGHGCCKPVTRGITVPRVVVALTVPRVVTALSRLTVGMQRAMLGSGHCTW